MFFIELMMALFYRICHPVGMEYQKLCSTNDSLKKRIKDPYTQKPVICDHRLNCENLQSTRYIR